MGDTYTADAETCVPLNTTAQVEFRKKLLKFVRTETFTDNDARANVGEISDERAAEGAGVEGAELGAAVDGAAVDGAAEVADGAAEVEAADVAGGGGS